MTHAFARPRITVVCWIMMLLSSVAASKVYGSAEPVDTRFPVFQVFLDPNHDQTEFSFEHTGLSGGYVGDYIGITATPDYVYPVWSDNRLEGTSRGIYQAYFAPIPLRSLSGHVTADTAWKFGTLVSGTITVDSGATLTIHNGTKVVLDSGVSIVVDGNLVIEDGDRRPEFCGNPDDSGSWFGIRIRGTGSVDWGDGCVIQNARTAVRIDEGATSGEIRNVTVKYPAQKGFELGASVDMVNDTIIADTADHGIFINQCDPTRSVRSRMRSTPRARIVRIGTVATVKAASWRRASTCTA